MITIKYGREYDFLNIRQGHQFKIDMAPQSNLTIGLGVKKENRQTVAE